jgi:hypothetical protein
MNEKLMSREQEKKKERSQVQTKDYIRKCNTMGSLKKRKHET